MKHVVPTLVYVLGFTAIEVDLYLGLYVFYNLSFGFSLSDALSQAGIQLWGRACFCQIPGFWQIPVQILSLFLVCWIGWRRQMMMFLAVVVTFTILVLVPLLRNQSVFLLWEFWLPPTAFTMGEGFAITVSTLLTLFLFRFVPKLFPKY